jgi:hypothetical protein
LLGAAARTWACRCGNTDAFADPANYFLLLGFISAVEDALDLLSGLEDRFGRRSYMTKSKSRGFHKRYRLNSPEPGYGFFQRAAERLLTCFSQSTNWYLCDVGVV